ncbi:hypothetical protein [Chengkuizengella marina]|uniref:hypothetical protein n=1 Tax=Chengkuizengella marina TaxID=2507566 RepID=UPI00136E8977|nr:hypothetical protein [Chengkuizengella marina]
MVHEVKHLRKEIRDQYCQIYSFCERGYRDNKNIFILIDQYKNGLSKIKQIKLVVAFDLAQIELRKY